MIYESFIFEIRTKMAITGFKMPLIPSLDKVICHNPPLPGPPVHTFPVLNHDQMDHKTNQWSTGAEQQ